MSESREQVAARELAAKFDFECTGSDDHDLDNCNKCAGMREDLEKVVARALAACALREHDLYCVTCRRYVEGPHEARCERGAMMDLAMGENGGRGKG